MHPPRASAWTLDALASPGGTFKLLAADHRSSLRLLLRPDAPDEVSEFELHEAKRDIVGELSSHVTGVLLTPTSAADQMIAGSLAGNTALIVTSETDGYNAVRRCEPAQLIDGWSLERAHDLGAAAVKILVQQPIGLPELRRQDREFVLVVHARCRELGLGIVLEVLVPDGRRYGAGAWRDALVTAALELSPYCDLYKTSFPGFEGEPKEAAEACAALSRAAAAPWVVLSGGIEPERFERQLEIACREGASGFLAGRSIWADTVAWEGAERRRRLREQAVPRLSRYGDLTDRLAQSWRTRRASDLVSDPVERASSARPLTVVADQREAS